MNSLKCLLLISTLITITSCSGGGSSSAVSSLFGGSESPANGSSNNPESEIPETPPAEVETVKLQAALSAEPEYKIDKSDLETLKAEGIITDADLEKIKDIQ